VSAGRAGRLLEAGKAAEQRSHTCRTFSEKFDLAQAGTRTPLPTCRQRTTTYIGLADLYNQTPGRQVSEKRFYSDAIDVARKALEVERTAEIRAAACRALLNNGRNRRRACGELEYPCVSILPTAHGPPLSSGQAWAAQMLWKILKPSRRRSPCQSGLLRQSGDLEPPRRPHDLPSCLWKHRRDATRHLF